MQIIDVELPEEHTIVAGGDWQLGNAGFVRECAEDLVDRVASDEDTYWIQMGDAMEGIRLSDRRYEPSIHGEPVMRQQVEDVVDISEPAADSTICWLEGNHEQKAGDNEQYAAWMARRLSTLDREEWSQAHQNPEEGVEWEPGLVPFGTYQAIVRVHVDGELAYQIQAYHGHGSLLSRNHSTLVRKFDRLGVTSCEVNFAGHWHYITARQGARYNKAGHSELFIGEDGLESRFEGIDVVEKDGQRWVHPDHRWYAVCGCALRSRIPGETTYEERKGYKVADIGWNELTYDGSIDIEPHYWG